MIVYYLKKDGLEVPKKSHNRDACYDVFASTPPKIVGEEISAGLYKRIEYIEYGTNLFVKPAATEALTLDEAKALSRLMMGLVPRDDLFCLDARPRSSVSKYNLLLANAPGTIDEPYRGEIKMRFKYVMQPEDLVIWSDTHGFKFIVARVNQERIYQKGDRIVQMMATEVHPIQWIPTEQLDITARGAGGYGSTGK